MGRQIGWWQKDLFVIVPQNRLFYVIAMIFQKGIAAALHYMNCNINALLILWLLDNCIPALWEVGGLVGLWSSPVRDACRTGNWFTCFINIFFVQTNMCR